MRNSCSYRHWFTVFALLLMLPECDAIVSRGIKVTVENRSNSKVTDAQLRFDGGGQSLGTIESGRQVSLSIRTADESGLSLSFTNSRGNDMEKPLGVYLTRGASRPD